MSSSRLPGKALIDINGRPMIWHIFDRLKRTKTIDEIILATSSDKTDNPLAKYVKNIGYRVFRYHGDINDVVGRVLAAAKWVKADIIAGICGDCPLIDPKFVDDVVTGMIKTKADSAKLKSGQQCQHEGLDVCKMSALEVQYQNASQPYHKEHLNIYLKENSEKFKWFEVNLRAPFNKHMLRLSVDTISDLRFMREIYNRLWKNRKELINLNKVIALYKKDKKLWLINAEVKQKSKIDVSHKFIIRTDASEKIGLGHLQRMMALAKELQDKYFCGITFVARRNKQTEKTLSENNFNYFVIDSENDFYNFLKSNNATGVIIDTLFDVSIKQIRRGARKVIVIDRLDKKVNGADLYIIPNGHSVIPFKWKNIIFGAQYAIIRNEIKRQKRKKGKYVLICGGGADPKNITWKILKFLDNGGFKQPFGVYLGPFNKKRSQVKRQINKLNLNTFVLGDNKSFAEALAGCHFVILGFGQSIYEAFYLQVPVLAIAQHEEKLNKNFLKTKNFKYFGLIGEIDQEQFHKTFNAFAKMSQIEKGLVGAIDANGATRVAERIISAIT